MNKTFWILFFIVLVSANLLIYMISLDVKPRQVEEGFTEKNVNRLANIYYILFAAIILIAIAFIVMTLIRQNMQVYY